MSGLLKQYDSASAEESDLDLAVGREMNADVLVYKNSVATYGMQIDSIELGQQGSSSLPGDLENEIVESLPNQERIQSPFKDNNHQGEMDELCGSYFHKSSIEFMAKPSHNERGTEDSAHSQESPTKIGENGTQKMVGNSDLDGLDTAPSEENVKDISQEESHWHDSKPKNKNYYSRNSPTESRRIDVPISLRLSPGSTSKHSASQSISHQDSPGSTPKHSASPQPVGGMSVSTERSPIIHQSPNGHKPLSSHEGIKDPSYPPMSSRDRNSASPERSSRHRQSLSPKASDQAKEVPFQNHLSPPTMQPSASPYRSRHKGGSSLSRRSASPKTCNLPGKRRRYSRSVSRSPVRRRDSSSGRKRDHRGRSRSRSPYIRDNHRSPRRKYSPRRRSPSSKYHSSRRSPRPVHWVPPPNRRTGLGKPGNNLFVAGFSFLTTERDLERKFSRFGHVRDVRIVRDKRSGDSRGFGFLSLERDEDADAAIRSLDETEWNGRIILVEKTKSH